jgi:replicative DNA helicase
MFNIRNVVDRVLDQYQKAITREDHNLGLSTGFRQLDRMLGGLSPGLHMLASRPNMGKTTLMLNIVEHVSIELKVPCLIFSCDLPAYQIVRRMVFARARQSAFAPPNTDMVPDKSKQIDLKRAASEVAESPLYIEDSFDFSIESLRSIATRYRRDAGVGFIAIDHLHLLMLKPMMIGLSREREVVEIIGQLKSLVREFDIPLLLLTDLSRKPENRRGGVPRITDLHYGGMIELADTIALLCRPEYYADTDEERDALHGKAELVLCKSPAGSGGDVELHFNPMLLRFEEIEPGV